ncbi:MULTISPECIES: flotillin family protein [unclassified Streptomyces]|uniref:SPFH domain-containing protein n=1 Tax=unclassified Streptomyces TaxID=2593676 RepID=UPI00081F08A9|nr:MULTISPECIES: flotillin family protein [unclassified Streptomyces]MYZ39686.1 flotillin [Streptomyces sp. SID4917]SCG04818.1 SPFH domain / Band 7 family protein [Streptomyces sp. MnatMP-M17]
MLFWHVPAPNEAMLISGSKRQAQDTQFRIVTGHGSFVMPIKQKARMLSLALREAEIVEDCVTQQGIRLRVRAVAVFKVGDDAVSIANAARRFLAEQDRMEELVGRIFAGHLRSIVGGLTVEQIIRERDRVAQEVKQGSHSEMEKLGIVVDALQIQEIDDATGYIDNLAAPHAAAVASQARIAQAKSDQEAAEREQQAAALKAEYERDTAIKRAGFLAETEQVNARAAQAGPLAEARSSQETIEEQTALAERQAQLAAQRLEAEVRRPADAEAYRQRTLAEAARDRAKFEADGSAYTERALAQAQADANTARAASLKDGNQELIAANRLVENLPALADAASRGMSGANLTVLNGTDGVNDMAAGLVGQGMAILNSLKNGAVGTAKASSVDGKPSLRVTESN